MLKKDVQDLFNKAKRRPRGKSEPPPPKKSGCKSCGKVTWKPNR